MADRLGQAAQLAGNAMRVGWYSGVNLDGLFDAIGLTAVATFPAFLAKVMVRRKIPRHT